MTLNERHQQINKKLGHFYKSEFVKITNFVVTSDNDCTYLKKENYFIAKLLRLIYILIILVFTTITFFPLFLPASEQNKLASQEWLISLNIVAFVVLLIDYFFRWFTFPYRSIKKYKSTIAILVFPITGISFIMILSILPTLMSILTFNYNIDDDFFKFIKLFASFKILRLILLLKVVSAFNIFVDVFMKQKKILINIFIFIFSFTLIFALIIYSVEANQVLPNGEKSKIHSYWTALYFTIITMTTIGYGDIYPVTEIGQAIVICVAILGITMFTIPSGVLAAAFTYEMQQKIKEDKLHKTKKQTLKQLLINKRNKQIIQEIQTEEIEFNEIYFVEDINLDMFPEIKERLISFLGGDKNIKNYLKMDNNHYVFEIDDKRLINNDLFEIARIFNFRVTTKDW